MTKVEFNSCHKLLVNKSIPFLSQEERQWEGNKEKKKKNLTEETLSDDGFADVIHKDSLIRH